MVFVHFFLDIFSTSLLLASFCSLLGKYMQSSFRLLSSLHLFSCINKNSSKKVPSCQFSSPPQILQRQIQAFQAALSSVSSAKTAHTQSLSWPFSRNQGFNFQNSSDKGTSQSYANHNPYQGVVWNRFSSYRVLQALWWSLCYTSCPLSCHCQLWKKWTLSPLLFPDHVKAALWNRSSRSHSEQNTGPSFLSYLILGCIHHLPPPSQTKRPCPAVY